MPERVKINKGARRLTALAILMLITVSSQGQKKISFGLHADPVVSWFGSNINEVSNDGSRAGFCFGLAFNRYFSPNYSFSTGINLMTAGGRLTGTDSIHLDLPNFKYKEAVVAPGKTVIYKVQYVSIPLGLKLQTNQIGYLTVFADAGIDPKVAIGGKLDVPSLDIKGENAGSELRMFNLSYHITAGIEYGLGGNTAFVAGLGFENNFLDVTKDSKDDLSDIITQKIISFRLGVNF